jgi:peptide/nickel transport system permease protein
MKALASGKSAEGKEEPPRKSVWRPMVRYALVRMVTLVLAVIAAVYLTIVIANFGGFVDEIVASDIELQVGHMVVAGYLADLAPDERQAAVEETVAQMKDDAGLNDPFLLRTIRWLADGLTLNWGEPSRSRGYRFNRSGMSVGELISDNLSRTLLLFGVANLLLFVTSVSLALALSRRYGGLFDRLLVLLSPISSAPAWVYGVLLSTFLLRYFGFSSGGTFDTIPTDLQLTHLLVVLRHLLLPFAAIFLAGLFQSVYTWRSFFQVHSSEDYVEMAYARGTPSGRIQRNYILRPTLPALLTSFALLLAVLWQEVIALEHFFNVQGIGRLFVQALTVFDTPMIVAIVTVFAYLLAITVFILDIFYLLVDPRVRIGEQKQQQIRPRRRWRHLTASRRRSAGALFARRRRARNRERTLASLLGHGFPNLARAVWRIGVRLSQTVAAIGHYPSAVAGLTIILVLMGISVYATITIPYRDAIMLWRGDNTVWYRNPRDALPAWVNFFRRDDLPPTISFSTVGDAASKRLSDLGRGVTEVTIPFTFDYEYGGFPQDIIVDLETDYEERGPHVAISWVWQDGREKELTSFQPRPTDSYYVSRDDRLERRLRSDSPLQALFLGPEQDQQQPVKGEYTLLINALLFEPDSELDVEATILGQVYGLAGTDTQRRDLMIALLWGTPIALAFGLIAAFITSVGGMLIGALGAWYGGRVDRIVQFLTEVNLILPFFPVSLMIFIMYSKSIVTILAVTVALTLFGSNVKIVRATFLQVRTEPYVEAATAYGATDWRIVSRYLVPRIVTVLVPKLIILVPSYVFLEATLAFLGLTDPYLPTWGKLVVAALSYGVHADAAHLVIAPLGLLFMTGFAFAMVGLALERVFEPRLRRT